MNVNKRFSSSLFLACVVVIGLLIYSNTFHSAFQLDDHPALLENPFIRDLNLKTLFSVFNTRFVAGLTFALNYAIGQYDVLGYHLLNLIVHLASSMMVYWLVSLTFDTPAMKGNNLAIHRRLFSMISCLIFLTHPVQTEAVTYIWQRCTSLAALFYLASLVLYVKARLGDRTRVFYMGSLLCAVAAMLTKEIAISLPIAIGIYEFFFFDSLKQNAIKKFILLLPFALTLLIIPLMILTAGDSKLAILKPKIYTAAASGAGYLSKFVGADVGVMTQKEYLLTQLRVLITYVRLLFFPVNQNLLYEYDSSYSIMEAKTLVSFLLVISMIAAACFLIKKHRLLTFGLFLFFLSLSVESLVPQPAVIWEHRLYLPLAGFAIFFPVILFSILKNPKPVAAIAACVLLIFSIATYRRNYVWATEISLWEDVIKKSPHLAEAYFNLSVAYHGTGNSDREIDLLKKAVVFNPTYLDAQYNLGLLLKEKGREEDAIIQFKKVIGLNSRYSNAYKNLGVVYFIKGDYTSSIAYFKKIVEINPRDTDAYTNLGIAYLKNGDIGESIEQFKLALAIRPDDEKAHYNLAVANKVIGLDQDIRDRRS